MSVSAGLSIRPLAGLPLFGAGDDLAAALGDALVSNNLAPADGDVVVVAQKVVSKVEGRQVALDTVKPSAAAEALAGRTGKPAALCELILRESQQVLRAQRGIVIVRHRLRHVLANAGIDASNVGAPGGAAAVLLWPENPNASARRIRDALAARFSVRLAVIISDSLGRAWRIGTSGTAIGSAGLRPIRDRRGEVDLFGRVLEATVTGVADEIAAAASLVIGEAAERIPAVLVRGAVYEAVEAGVDEILRPSEIDLFL